MIPPLCFQKHQEVRRCGGRTHDTAVGMIKALGVSRQYFNEYYHELVVDDKLVRNDQEQFLRGIQYIGDVGFK